LAPRQRALRSDHVRERSDGARGVRALRRGAVRGGHGWPLRACRTSSMPS
jgi:hypothetical protein